MSSQNETKKISLKDHPIIKNVTSKLRVTKVVATRSVKGSRGDNYVGFSAAWDSTQDDAGGASTLISTQDEADAVTSVAQSGLTLKEAKVASLLLGMQADISAHQNAFAGGNATAEQLENAVRVIRANYGRLLMQVLDDSPTESAGR